MKALFGSFIVDGRNKVNGHVVSKNRYGSYIRTKVTPVNPQTDAQQAARNNLATNSQTWKGLTETQRQSWIDAAQNFPFTDIFGNIKFLSGQALFVKLNNNLVNAGGTTLTTAPAPVAIPAIASIALTAAAGTPAISLTYSIPDATGDNIIFVEATPNISPGKSFVKNQFRLIQHGLADDTASPDNLLTAYQAVFGNPVENQKIFVRVRLVNQVTGQSGIPLQTVAIVAA
jgi:hypothetical protein